MSLKWLDLINFILGVKRNRHNHSKEKEVILKNLLKRVKLQKCFKKIKKKENMNFRSY